MKELKRRLWRQEICAEIKTLKYGWEREAEKTSERDSTQLNALIIVPPPFPSVLMGFI